MSAPIMDFTQALLAHGLEPGEVLPDGILRRCPSNGSGQDRAGYYAMFDNGEGVFGGFFGDWRGNLYETWLSGNAKELDKKGREALEARINAIKAQAQKQRDEEYRTVAAKAVRLWKASKAADDNHPYLKAKKVQAYGLRVSKAGQLVIPVMDAAGNICSLQFIDAAPDQGKFGKKFMTGGQIGGNFFAIWGKREVFYICEGYATGASIHQATGQSVICAFNAGNLKQVGMAIRARHPKTALVIAADNDQWTDGNPGKTKGMEAAKEVGALFALPRFKDETRRPTDFNDLAAQEGLDAVRLLLKDAKAPQNKPSVKHPFEPRQDGVYFLEEDRDGSVTPVKICSPLEVVAVTHNEHNEQWGRLLKVTDLKNIVHLWAMPLAMAWSGRGEFIEELCDIGLRPAPGRKTADRIRLFISDYPTTEMVLCADRIGWHGESFVLPDKTFVPSDQPGRVVFQGEARKHNFRTKGALPEWQEHISRYAVGNSRLALALSIALAGPLLHLLDGESGGFHFVGDTSAGKSTILLAAGSVCGGGLEGYHKQWRSTDNALEAIASAHCDTLLCLDEIGQCDGRVVAETSYMLANGQGKQRLGKGAALKKAYTWRLVFLSTGEMSCAEKVRENGGRMKAGQEVRVLDIPAVPAKGMGVFETLHGFPSGAALADHLRAHTKRLYGHPLPIFLSKLVSNASEVRSIWDDFASRFMAQTCPDTAPHGVQRACKRFALAAMAGTLATSWDIFPWPGNQATEAASICFQDWLTARGGTADMDAIHGVDRVRAFLMAHGSSRFEIIGGGDGQKIVNRAGFKQSDDFGDWLYLIAPEAFRQEICAGLNFKTVCQALQELGALLAPEGRFMMQARTSGQRGYFYVVSEKALFSTGGADPD